jgi:excisionase family DNA binding protein
MPRDKLLNIDEVAGYLRLNRYTVYRMAERGELPGAKIARRWRFSEMDLHVWLKQQKSARASPRRRRPPGNKRKAATR